MPRKAATAASKENPPPAIFATPWPNPLRTPLPTLAPLCLTALRGLFARFDGDRSGGLSREELNCYLASVDEKALCVDEAAFENVYLKTQRDVCGLQGAEIAFDYFKHFYVLLFKVRGSEAKALEMLDAHLRAAGLEPLTKILPPVPAPPPLRLVPATKGPLGGVARAESPPTVPASQQQPSDSVVDLSREDDDSHSDGAINLVDDENNYNDGCDDSPVRIASAPVHDFFNLKSKRSRLLASDNASAPFPSATDYYLPQSSQSWCATQPDFPWIQAPFSEPDFATSTTITYDASPLAPWAPPTVTENDARPRLCDPTVYEEALRLAARTQELPPPPSSLTPNDDQGEMWSVVHAPKSSAEFLENAQQVDALRDWILEYYSSNKPGEQSNDVDNEVHSDDEDFHDADADQTPRVAVLVGPSGSGKTQAVYTAAAELGLGLKEISNNEDRTKGLLKALVGEVTQSNQLKSRRDIVRPLLLIDEADLAFEEDRDGFLAALRSVVVQAKCPVVLTCNRLVPGLSEDGRGVSAIRPCLLLRFSLPRPTQVNALLSRVSAASSSSSTPLSSQLTLPRDPRHALLMAQFWQHGACPAVAPPLATGSSSTTPSHASFVAPSLRTSLPRVEVHSIRPALASAGQWIDVFGQGFAATREGDSLFVEIDQVECAETQLLSDAHLRVRIPSWLAPKPAIAPLPPSAPVVVVPSRPPAPADATATNSSPDSDEIEEAELVVVPTRRRRSPRSRPPTRMVLSHDVCVGLCFALGKRGRGYVRSTDDPIRRHNGLLRVQNPATDFVPDQESDDDEESPASSSGTTAAESNHREESPCALLPAIDLDVSQVLNQRTQLLETLRVWDRASMADELAKRTRYCEDAFNVAEDDVPQGKSRLAWKFQSSARAETLSGEIIAALSVPNGFEDVNETEQGILALRERATEVGLLRALPRYSFEFVHTVPFIVAMARSDNFLRRVSAKRRFQSHFPVDGVDPEDLEDFGLRIDE